ncbi:DMT family transporter [Cellulomonas cellasea]|uniref:Drug/metabolite transporter (DMT)-like permease n=1 Tax=Cellulomonas cellasea TaxID=43670 RepID=A0A7W4YCZ7_9CELL|nr:DMT family transporter [Cellulomonas cellasea]MBB2924187.1 drug/metabolite transporter (DMT)-like permease [Cellulomonas cellasea]
MTNQSSAIARPSVALPPRPAGLLWGLLGVTAFSLTVPLTRVAVADGQMSPLFVGAARAVVAALIAGAALAVTRQPLPRGRQRGQVAVVAAGVVAGFPLLTSFALTSTPASHGVVVIALLPAATAIVAVLRTREHVSPVFWAATAAGVVAALVFAALHGGGLGGLHAADLLLLGAVAAAAVGYAEGGLLARDLGAWQTVSWALVVASPVMVALTATAVRAEVPRGGTGQWAAVGYLSVVSMFLGFVAWYRGLAIGPMTQVSQVQLTQPVLSLGWAAVLLHESVTWTTAVGGAAVVACAGVAVRTRAGATPRARSPRAARRSTPPRVPGPA